MSVEDPVASLALADAASRRLAGRGRWVRRYCVFQAAHWFVWIPAALVTAVSSLVTTVLAGRAADPR